MWTFSTANHKEHLCFMVNDMSLFLFLITINIMPLIFSRGSIQPFPLKLVPVQLTAQLRSSHQSAPLLHQPRNGAALILVNFILIKLLFPLLLATCFLCPLLTAFTASAFVRLACQVTRFILAAPSSTNSSKSITPSFITKLSILPSQLSQLPSPWTFGPTDR